MCNEQSGRPHIWIIRLGDLKVGHSNKTAHQHKGDDVALLGTADAAHCVHKAKYVGRHGVDRQGFNRQRCVLVVCGLNHLKYHHADAHNVIQGSVRLMQSESVRRDVVVVERRDVHQLNCLLLQHSWSMSKQRLSNVAALSRERSSC